VDGKIALMTGHKLELINGQLKGQSCEFVGMWPSASHVIRFLPERRGSGSYQSCRLMSSIAQTQPASKFWRVAPMFSRAHAKSSSLVAGLGAPGIIKVFNQSRQRSERARASADDLSRGFMLGSSTSSAP